MKDFDDMTIRDMELYGSGHSSMKPLIDEFFLEYKKDKNLYEEFNNDFINYVIERECAKYE